MKTKFKTGFHLIVVLLLITSHSFAQSKQDDLSVKKNEAHNKAAVLKIYNLALNRRQFEVLDGIISDDFDNATGKHGAEAFSAVIKTLLKGFPDAQWKVLDLIADDNKVVAVQEFTGTNTGPYPAYGPQTIIDPTGKKTVTRGVVIYEFKAGKIISGLVETDRLQFLQDMGILPSSLATLAKKRPQSGNVALVDKMIVPKSSVEELRKQSSEIGKFIKSLPGLISQQAFEKEDAEGNLVIQTTAIWESQDALNNAREAVQGEFKRLNLDTHDLFTRLNIKVERAAYRVVEN